ncbi:hypothetical protein DFH06DRAFT_1131245 [Mycena polygramma]|nr:hypothetical protein DFH06DRAFT_1131245 [Mycena polygramma]
MVLLLSPPKVPLEPCAVKHFEYALFEAKFENIRKDPPSAGKMMIILTPGSAEGLHRRKIGRRKHYLIQGRVDMAVGETINKEHLKNTGHSSNTLLKHPVRRSVAPPVEICWDVEGGKPFHISISISEVPRRNHTRCKEALDVVSLTSAASKRLGISFPERVELPLNLAGSFDPVINWDAVEMKVEMKGERGGLCVDLQQHQVGQAELKDDIPRLDWGYATMNESINQKPRQVGHAQARNPTKHQICTGSCLNREAMFGDTLVGLSRSMDDKKKEGGLTWTSGSLAKVELLNMPVITSTMSQ